jgi:hypothetical protein
MMDQLYTNKLDWGVQVSRGDSLNAGGHPAAAVRLTGGRVRDKRSSARTGAWKNDFLRLRK